MLRRSLTTFSRDESGAVAIDMIGITAILTALALPVLGYVSSALTDQAQSLQRKLSAGGAEAGVVVHPDVVPRRAIGVEQGG
jgi:Flp pilus assembly pilin Flp